MPVNFELCYTLEGRREQRAAHAEDLSAGGLRLIVDEDLFAGCVLNLEFTLPDAFLAHVTVEKDLYEDTQTGGRRQTISMRPPPFSPMSVRAKVLTNFFNTRVGQFEYGVAFIQPDRKTQSELERFVSLWQRASAAHS